MPDLRVVRGDRNDTDRWCLNCMQALVWLAEPPLPRWVHEQTSAYLRDPTPPANPVGAKHAEMTP